MRLTPHSLVACSLTLAGFCCPAAHGSEQSPTEKLLHLYVAPALGGCDWEFQHPYYGTTVPDRWETVSGRVEPGSAIGGGFELSKTRVGFKIEFEVIPSKLTITQEDRRLDHTLYCGELSLLLFPHRGRDDWSAGFIGLGAGVFSSTGDVSNGGLIIKAEAGYRMAVSNRFGICLSIQSRYLKYHQVEVQDQITKDIGVMPLAIRLGFVYGLDSR